MNERGSQSLSFLRALRLARCLILGAEEAGGEHPAPQARNSWRLGYERRGPWAPGLPKWTESSEGGGHLSHVQGLECQAKQLAFPWEGSWAGSNVIGFAFWRGASRYSRERLAGAAQRPARGTTHGPGEVEKFGHEEGQDLPRVWKGAGMGVGSSHDHQTWVPKGSEAQRGRPLAYRLPVGMVGITLVAVPPWAGQPEPM